MLSIVGGCAYSRLTLEHKVSPAVGNVQGLNRVRLDDGSDDVVQEIGQILGQPGGQMQDLEDVHQRRKAIAHGEDAKKARGVRARAVG
jgi:hypothetical protein